MADQTPSTRTLSRSRGAASGVLLVLLGAWGALAPFIGPYFNFAYTPDKEWHWTAARGWFEVLPGSVAVVGGLLLLIARGRGATMLGAWLGILAGVWFVVGLPLQTELTLGTVGQPIGTSSGQRAAETLGLFTGLGAIIIFLAATAFGRLSVVTVRDLRLAERRESERAEAEQLAAREEAEREQAERERWDREQNERHRGWQQDGPDDQHHPYDQRADQPTDQPTGRSTDQATADGETRQMDPATDQQAGPQADPRADQQADDRRFHSDLGQRDGEQTEQYSSPNYGRHDANVRTGGSGESGGDPAAETSTFRQPR